MSCCLLDLTICYKALPLCPLHGMQNPLERRIRRQDNPRECNPFCQHQGSQGSGTRLLKRLTLVHCAWSLVVCNRKGPGVENGGEPPNASLETAEKDWFSNLWWLFKVNCLHSLSRESSCQTASFGTPRAVARVRRKRQRKIKLENFFHPLPPNSTYYHLSIVSAFPWNDCNYVKAENQSCSGVSIL